MKKILSALFVPLLLLCIATTVHAQTDAENIQHAQNAINVAHNCDDALRFLSLVSADGKMSADYFLCMGNAHDCKTNNEQALYYYNKYLELQPKNDSVKKRVAELSDKSAQQNKSANEQRVAKESYQQAAHGKKKKKKKHYEIDGHYAGIGIAYDMGMGDDAPFKAGINLNYNTTYPIINNHLILDFTLNSDILFSANTEWYEKVYNASASDVKNPGPAFTEDIEFSPMGVIINTKKVAWAAGPVIGFKFAYLPEPVDIYSSSFTSGGSIFTLCYGVKTTVLLNDNVSFLLEYSAMPSTTVTTSANTTPTNVSHNILRAGVGIRFGWY